MDPQKSCVTSACMLTTAQDQGQDATMQQAAHLSAARNAMGFGGP